jgi:hypothetical protein
MNLNEDILYETLAATLLPDLKHGPSEAYFSARKKKSMFASKAGRRV